MIGRFRTATLLLTLVTLAMVFFNLGGIPLLDPDEPVYAETPKEMIAFHDFLSPRIYGEYWYDKPPMYYWLVAASFKVFGISEFAARFPSAVLALATVWLLYWRVGKQLGQRVGLYAGLILATSIEFFYLAKAAVTDITLLFFLTGCLLAFSERKYYLAYICAGLATVTKGPVGLIFPGTIILLHLAFTKNWSELKRLKLVSGLALYALVAVPWYWLMYNVHGTIFIETFLGFHNITRFTSPEHPEGVLWYYYIPVLLVGFFPWIALMGQSIWNGLRQSRRQEYRYLLLAFIWAAFIFVFFTISRTKLVSYILPMFPPLAILGGWYVDWLAQRAKVSRVGTSWGILLAVISGLLAAAFWFAQKDLPELQTGIQWLLPILIAMPVASAYAIYRRQIIGAFTVQVVSMLLFSFVLVGVLFPAAAPRFTTKPLAQHFTSVYDGTSPVYVVKFLHPGFTFYSDVYGVELKKNEQLKAAVQQSPRAYFILREGELNSLDATERASLQLLKQTPSGMLLLKEGRDK